MGLLDLKSNLSRENFKRQVDERLPSKEEQAIIDVQDRTRAREKQIAEIRNAKPTPDKMGKSTGLFSTTPAIDVFNESPLNQPKPTTDFFQNTNARGFTQFKKQKDTDFVVNNDKVNTDTVFRQSQPQQFQDVRGNGIQLFSATNRAPSDKNEPSRILLKHEKDNFLERYYDQLKGNGELGIKRQSPSAPQPLGLVKAPFIVRDVGNRWGIDTFNPDNIKLSIGGVGELLRGGFNILDQFGGAVLGRQPSVFADRAFADIGRTASFLASVKGVGFLEKQRILKRENPQDVLTSAKYGKTADINKLSTSVKKYDMNPPNLLSRSLLSQPGIVGRATNKQGDVSGNLVFSINRQEPSQLVDILDLDKLQEQINVKTPDSIRDAFEEIKSYNVEVDSKLNFTSDKLQELLTPVSDVVAGAATQLKDLASSGLNYLKSLKGPKLGLKLTNPFKTPKLPKLKNPFTLPGGGGGFDFGGGIDIGIPGSVRNVGNFLANTAKAFGSINLNKVPLNASKNLAAEIDLEAFAEIGQDKVNLIPYGKRNVDVKKTVAEGRYTGDALIDGKTENELDFCPFRFEDMNGNLIVFRAILSGITDTFTPDYVPERYIGRADQVYVYQGTTREISFTFDVYPKSAEELPVLWEKLNYLAGLTYPEYAPASGGNGLSMISPFCKLTIGQMYTNAPGYISGLTYSIMDESTWEIMFAKLPKYVQVQCNFIYIGNYLQTNTNKHFDLPFVQGESYDVDGKISNYKSAEKLNKKTQLGKFSAGIVDSGQLDSKQAAKALGLG